MNAGVADAPLSRKGRTNVYAPKWPSTNSTTTTRTRRSRGFRRGRANTSRTGTAFCEGSDGTAAATARSTRTPRPAQMRNVVRQSVRLSTTVPRGMPATAATDIPDITTAAALLAWRSGTMRIAMLTPMAQNTPLANPMTNRVSRTRSGPGTRR
jgi:hypothetical protein